MILIDNYDSFTYNIVQYLEELGIQPKIYENDKITIEELKKIKFNSLIISPGAGTPDTAGISMQIINEFYKTKKILGTGTSAFPVQCSDGEGLPGSGRAECCDVRECCIYGYEE